MIVLRSVDTIERGKQQRSHHDSTRARNRQGPECGWMGLGRTLNGYRHTLSVSSCCECILVARSACQSSWRRNIY